MEQLNHKIKTALDEGRILIIGAQILLGLQFRSAFEQGFQKLAAHAKYAELGALAVLLVAIVLLMWPAAYHQIVENGEDNLRVNNFVTKVMGVALLPFALALSLNFFIVTELLFGRTQAIIAGGLSLLTALFFWYGIEALRRAHHERERTGQNKMTKEHEQQEAGHTKLKNKIEHVLTECRVVLPGAQALLGFQFIALLMEEFSKLPTGSKYVHFLSLCLVALTVIFLMTPAAYHRLVEQGEDTEHFHRFASRTLLSAMVPLALGIAGDFYVVANKVLESTSLAVVLSIVTVCLFYGLWFGFTFYRRNQRGNAQQRQVQFEVPSLGNRVG